MHAVDTGEAKRRLANLTQYLPNVPAEVCSLGAFLARYLNQQVTPEGFVVSFGVALDDLSTSSDSVTKRALSHPLAGKGASVYDTLELYIPDIARAIFSEEFAALVLKAHPDSG